MGVEDTKRFIMGAVTAAIMFGFLIFGAGSCSRENARLENQFAIACVQQGFTYIAAESGERTGNCIKN